MTTRLSPLAAAALTVFAVIGACVAGNQQPIKPPVVVSLDRMYAAPTVQVVVPVQPVWLQTQPN